MNYKSSPITILTKPPIKVSNKLRFKRFGKRALRLQASKYTEPPENYNHRGPGIVLQNLLYGLKKIKYPYNYNPPEDQVHDWIGVLSNVAALSWAIEYKKNNNPNCKIAAGPNLVILPDERGGILTHPEIDFVVTPCTWVKNKYRQRCPQLGTRLREWASGVDSDYWLPENHKKADSKKQILVYDKILGPNQLEEKMKAHIQYNLIKSGRHINTIKYGAYTKEEYKKQLARSILVVFLSRSESQGIALFEAWSMDVPAYVWDRGYWEYKGLRRPSTSCPYLEPRNGKRFKSTNEFIKDFPGLINNLNQFKPREFILDKYTLKKSAENYLEVFYKK